MNHGKTPWWRNLPCLYAPGAGLCAPAFTAPRLRLPFEAER
jgi:hypothetical protein